MVGRRVISLQSSVAVSLVVPQTRLGASGFVLAADRSHDDDNDDDGDGVVAAAVVGFVNLNTTLLDKRYNTITTAKNCCGVTRGVLPLPEAWPGAEPDCKVPGLSNVFLASPPSPPLP